MATYQLHSDIRAALSAADELSRDEHSLHKETLSQVLAALRTKLRDIDLELGRSHRAEAHALDELHDVALKVRRHLEHGAPGGPDGDHARVDALLLAVGDLERALRDADAPETAPTLAHATDVGTFSGPPRLPRAAAFALFGGALAVGAAALLGVRAIARR